MSGAPPRRVFILSRELGCPVNLSLTTRLHNYVARNGWSITDAEAADSIVIVSCSNLPEVRQGVVGAVEHYARLYPAKRILVSCCFVEEDRVKAANVAYLSLAQQDDFDTWFAPAVPLREVTSGSTLAADQALRSRDRGRPGATPYNVLVSAGCLNHCSYCIGKSVFPTVQSVPVAAVVAECKEGIRKGYTNFIIGGSDIASYGRDLGCGVSDLFAALFSQAFTRDAAHLVVGFKGFEPAGFMRQFDGLRDYFQQGRVAWLCLPVQTGSDRVLRSMNRKYKIADVVKIVAELRRIAPSMRIETDFIYCYPTETREDFEASLAVVDLFDHVQMSMFERHEQTAAAALPDAFDAEERERRRTVARAIEARQAGHQRPECPPRHDVELPSPHGSTGFAILEGPK